MASPVTLVVFLLGIGYFVYLNYRTLSFLLILQDRVYRAKSEFVKTEKEVAEAEINSFENNSDEAKKRYQKEFFNTLEDGEYMVFLHREGDVIVEREEKRKLTTWEKYSQQVKLWWKNL